MTMTTEKPTQGMEHKFLSLLAHLAGGARGHPFPQHPPHRLWELVGDRGIPRSPHWEAPDPPMPRPRPPLGALP